MNLTIPSAHASVTAAALEAGKHVHTEKPVALRYEEARELVELAERTGRRLSCSPATLLGEAQQTAWKLVRDGALGEVRVVYAEANWGRIESWHPTPQALYDVGPLVDVGVYPLTILTAMFGPVRRVVAYGTTLEPERVTLAGEPFRLDCSRLHRLAARVRRPGRREADDDVLGPARQAAGHGVPRSRRKVAPPRELSGVRRRARDVERRRRDLYDGASRPRALPRHRLGASDRGPRRGDRRGPTASRERRAGGARRRGPRGDRAFAGRRRRASKFAPSSSRRSPWSGRASDCPVPDAGQSQVVSTARTRNDLLVSLSRFSRVPRFSSQCETDEGVAGRAVAIRPVASETTPKTAARPTRP